SYYNSHEDPQPKALPAAISLRFAENIFFDHNTIGDFGASGIAIELGTKNVYLQHNRLSNIGGTCIINGRRNDQNAEGSWQADWNSWILDGKLQPQKIYILGNTLEDCATVSNGA